MLFYFPKSIRCLKILTAVSGGLAILFFILVSVLEGSYIYISSALARIILSVVLLFILEIASIRYSIHVAEIENRRLLNLLYKTCDPQTFISKYEPLVTFPNRDKKYIIRCQLNLARGYIAAGDFEKAEELLDHVELDEKDIIHLELCGEYYSQKFELYFFQAKMEQAEEMLQKEDTFANHPLHMKSLRKPAKNKYLLHKAWFETVNQKSIQPIEEMTKQLRSVYTVYDMVYSQFFLGIFYGKHNKTEEELQAFRYVAEHGNTMLVAEQARSRLIELEE